MSVIDSAVKLVIGDLEEKKAYKQVMDRADALPEDYRFAFRKIRTYMYTVGSVEGSANMFSDLSLFTNLVELFEVSAAEGKPVLEVTGGDVDRFADELMRASVANDETLREKLNREIEEYFDGKGQE